MKLADPFSVKARLTRVVTLFAASQLQGERPKQEDFFLNYNDQCIALADGLGGVPNSEVAARLACETAVWAFRHVRLRPFYWADKKLFLKRIFRTTNITLWQKQREKSFEKGLATTLVTCIIGDKSVWVGGVGDTRIYHLSKQGKLTSLFPDDTDTEGRLTNVLGVKRYGLVPHVITKKFTPGDVIFLATDGVWHYVTGATLEKQLKNAGQTTSSLSKTVIDLLNTAAQNGSTDNMTAIVIKRIFAW